MLSDVFSMTDTNPTHLLGPSSARIRRSIPQPGLSHVYDQILGFDGNEFYTRTWPALYGTRAEDVATKFANAVPIGVNRKGQIILNLPSEFLFQPGDGLIVLAEARERAPA